MNINRLSALCGCMMIPLTLLSCGGSVDGSGEIAVAPYNVQAAAELSTYELNVVADCSWTAEIQSADEVSADWLSLSKTKGTGDAKLSLRVFENKYSSERKAVVNFLVGETVKATVNVTQAGVSGGEDMSSADIRVGSYNLRMSSLDDSDAQNKWSVRKNRLLTSIKENDFDIFGVQEVDLTTQKWLKDNLGSEYECWFFSPYAQSGTGDKAQGILFRKNKLSISDKHYFWASDTPETCSVNDTGDSGNFRRGGHCAIFT
ncbi:MAG: BACON domain-containing protein, partial [Candidatus Cryptobacteroides sp.]